ncbi:MAG: tRNA (5-methylaminomethyl-2-thiouridine)(34)-methyltransferase MnmD [Pseudomonadota bacterium]
MTDAPKVTRLPPPVLEWREGVPVSHDFDDVYYSTAGGRAETGHVFLAGNGLPDRWVLGQPFFIAELGLGTGLNVLETWDFWEEVGRPGSITLTSFEQWPMEKSDLARAHAAWPDLAARSARLVAVWDQLLRGEPVALAPGFTVSVVWGDANVTLPLWSGRADAWFLDGFSPARNPELWNADLMSAVFRCTRPEGTFATYTAAGWVRRALAVAGFEVERKPGYGTKRDMTVGRRGLTPGAPTV